MDGWRRSVGLKRTRTPSIPVIVLTQPARSDASGAEFSGADLILTKPSVPRCFAQEIRRFGSKSRRRDAAGSLLMKAILPLFIFIDAWVGAPPSTIPSPVDFAPYRKRLDSVSAIVPPACLPSSPVAAGEHRNWCYSFMTENSPFKSLRRLRGCRRRSRVGAFSAVAEQFGKVHLKFRGYFDLYNIPFKHISLFDFTEKKSPLKPGGMNRGPNIFDFLEIREDPLSRERPTKSEWENLQVVTADVRCERIDFAFIYWPALDGLLHRVGNQSPALPAKLRQYEQWISQLLSVARQTPS